MFTPIGPDDGYDLATLNYELDRVKTAVFVGSNAAFLAPLMCSMEFVWTKDVQTAATDGCHILWNPDDFLMLDHELRKSTLIHEIWHPGNLTFLRQGDRDMSDWNIATDISINNNLKKDGYKIESPYFIWDDKYRDWACEDIYDAIHKQCAPWGPGGSQGQPQNGPGSPAPGSEGYPGDRNTGQDMLPQTPQTLQQAINNVIQAAHAATAAKDPGAVPGNVRELINKFLSPVVPWETVLDRFLEDKCSEDYTWRRPNRRYQDIYLPSRDADEGRLTHLIFYEDVSGSISEHDSIRFNSELKHIKDKFNPEKMTIVQFDTRITFEKTFLEDDAFEEIEITGRGGTDLRPVREHIDKHRPTAAIVFSDLYVAPMVPIDVPVLWIAIGNKAAKVNCGQLIHIKE